MNKENTILAVPARAAIFKALGDPTRLRVFEFLRSCCCPVSVEATGDVRPMDGPTVGEVCCRVTGADQITSTVSRHLRELQIAGLITIERRGKNKICGVNPEILTVLSAYFADEPTADTSTDTSTGTDRETCC